MKDFKFVILLLLITFIGLVNLIWLTSLQMKYNNLHNPGSQSFDSNSEPVDELRVKNLHIVHDNGDTAISLYTNPRGYAVINFSEPNEFLSKIEIGTGPKGESFITMNNPDISDERTNIFGWKSYNGYFKLWFPEAGAGPILEMMNQWGNIIELRTGDGRVEPYPYIKLDRFDNKRKIISVEPEARETIGDSVKGGQVRGEGAIDD
jgi:hypothetical protein